VPDQNLIHSIQQDLLLRDTQCQSWKQIHPTIILYLWANLK
jgi:hypothetical protein